MVEKSEKTGHFCFFSENGQASYPSTETESYDKNNDLVQ